MNHILELKIIDSKWHALANHIIQIIQYDTGNVRNGPNTSKLSKEDNLCKIRFRTIIWYHVIPYDTISYGSYHLLQSNLFAQLVLHEINWYSLHNMALLVPKFLRPGSFMFPHQGVCLKTGFRLMLGPNSLIVNCWTSKNVFKAL